MLLSDGEAAIVRVSWIVISSVSLAGLYSGYHALAFQTVCVLCAASSIYFGRSGKGSK